MLSRWCCCCCTTTTTSSGGGSTRYKGVFILILILLILLDYLFGSITESVFNNVHRSQEHVAAPCQHAPSLKSIFLKNKTNLSPLSSSIITTTTTTNHSFINETITLNSTTITTINTNDTLLLIGNNTATTITTNIDVQLNLTTNQLPPCPDISTNLHGRIDVIKSPIPTIEQLYERFSPWLKLGGHWSPEPNCYCNKSVALIIPFRCRNEHLLLFLQHMHPFLKRQQLDYTIFIIEQDGNNLFNRAMLMNIGYIEALKLRNYDCFIFHDIDLLPEDDRNLYTCPNGQPRHMSVAVDIFDYKLPYQSIFGGVSAINRQDFRLLNGFSNSFWGWGGEDDDMANRIRYHNLYISRYPLTIARYTMLTHKKDKPSPNRYNVLKQGQKRYDKDGLNSLKYKLIDSKQNLLYTWFLVSIEMPTTR